MLLAVRVSEGFDEDFGPRDAVAVGDEPISFVPEAEGLRPDEADVRKLHFYL